MLGHIHELNNTRRIMILKRKKKPYVLQEKVHFKWVWKKKKNPMLLNIYKYIMLNRHFDLKHIN